MPPPPFKENTPERPAFFIAMVYYICDGTKCEHCIDECHYTSNRLYARDTEHDFAVVETGDLWERPKDGDNWELDE